MCPEDKLKYSHDKEDICIVLATYNPNEDYFKQQIQSLLNQTYSGWVCIVVDDQSNEQSRKVISKYCADTRFKIFFSESVKKKSLGSYKNFEFGLSLVPSHIKYIALCDQDDVWEPNKLEFLRNKLLNSQDRFVLVHSDLTLIDGNNKILNTSCWAKEGRRFPQFELINQPDEIKLQKDTESLIFRNTVTGCASMFKSDLLKIALPFPKHEQDLNQDQDKDKDKDKDKDQDKDKDKDKDKECEYDQVNDQKYKNKHKYNQIQELELEFRSGEFDTSSILFKNQKNLLNKTPFHHDQWLAICSSAFGNCIPVAEKLVKYRQHNNNVVGAHKSKGLFSDLKLLLSLKELIIKCVKQINDRRLLVLNLDKRIKETLFEIQKLKATIIYNDQAKNSNEVVNDITDINDVNDVNEANKVNEANEDCDIGDIGDIDEISDIGFVRKTRKISGVQTKDLNKNGKVNVSNIGFSLELFKSLSAKFNNDFDLNVESLQEIELQLKLRHEILKLDKWFSVLGILNITFSQVRSLSYLRFAFSIIVGSIVLFISSIF